MKTSYYNIILFIILVMFEDFFNLIKIIILKLTSKVIIF